MVVELFKSCRHAEGCAFTSNLKAWPLLRIRCSRIPTSDFEMVGRTGFEPVKAKPVDLQSTPFDRFGTYPLL